MCFKKSARKIGYLAVPSRAQFAEKKTALKPKIVIEGDQFAKAGFNIGDTVTVEFFNNKVIISKP